RARPVPCRPLTLAFAVHGLGEARELGRCRAHRAESLLVVHAHRADQADRSERTVDEPIARADHRALTERRMAEILADTHDWAVRLVRRPAEHIEERRPLLHEL